MPSRPSRSEPPADRRRALARPPRSRAGTRPTGQPTPGYEPERRDAVGEPDRAARGSKCRSTATSSRRSSRGRSRGAGLANAGQVFPPFVSTQFEAGAKLDLGNFGATLSAFQITWPSSFTNPHQQQPCGRRPAAQSAASSSRCSASLPAGLRPDRRLLDPRTRSRPTR